MLCSAHGHNTAHLMVLHAFWPDLAVFHNKGGDGKS